MNRQKRTKLHPREANGQWMQATTENMFGLRVLVCPECRAFNPYSRAPIDNSAPFINPADFNRWEVPTACHNCGKTFDTGEVGTTPHTTHKRGG